jgi:hypothetical protein
MGDIIKFAEKLSIWAEFDVKIQFSFFLGEGTIWNRCLNAIITELYCSRMQSFAFCFLYIYK